MAQFFKAQKRKAPAAKPVDITIEHYNHDGDGIGYHQGKICFVEGALPGETVKVKLSQNKAKVAKGQAVNTLKAHPERIQPQCVHFTECGGCQLQYVPREQQLLLKQQAVEALFKRFGKLDTLPWQPSLTAEPWHYRRTARVGVWFDKNSGQFTVGFRKRNSKQLTAISECRALSKAFDGLFQAFTELLPKLSCGRAVTHLELVAATDVNLVVMRHTKPLSKVDIALLTQLGDKHQWCIASEAQKGKITALTGTALPTLSYQVTDNTELSFYVGDFIQVNANINEQMIDQAIAWLDLQNDDRLMDLFCGIGNFSLPLARHCKQVVGVEGVDAMVERATDNAKANKIDNASFYQADLSADFGKHAPQWLDGGYNKVLLDPARAGAEAMMKPITQLEPAKVLYVSCDPLTMARDSATLLQAGYRLQKIALMDMFSHTRHIEVMALFTN